MIILCIFTVPLFADVFGKTGTASLQFLKLGVDARAIGMGEAYTAVSDDISSVYWNPAGLAMKYEKQAFFSHTNWIADTYHEFVAASMPTNYGFFAIFASVFHTTAMEETDEFHFGFTGRTFYFSNIAAGITYANAFTDRFAFGLTGKYLRENIADESVNSMSFDLGSSYNTGFRNIIIGMSLRNFGPEVRYRIDDDKNSEFFDDRFDTFDDDEDGIGTPFPMPMNFSLGIVGDVYRRSDRYLIASAQLDNCVDRKETWNVGAEYNINNLFLRGGYQIGLDAASWSAGFGVRVPTRMAILNIDYAFTDMGRLQEDFMSGAHRFSLKMSF
jgi:hypothetical protein